MSTQQQWAFRVGDGATPTEVFTQLAGMYEAPEIKPINKTMRDETTIDIARTQATKRKVFNRQIEGQEFSFECDYLPESATQGRLISQAGVNAGVNIEFEYEGPTETVTWSFNALVTYTPKLGVSNDENAVDKVEFSFTINSDIVETVTP